jgi:hypothetical protein
MVDVFANRAVTRLGSNFAVRAGLSFRLLILPRGLFKRDVERVLVQRVIA